MNVDQINFDKSNFIMENLKQVAYANNDMFFLASLLLFLKKGLQCLSTEQVHQKYHNFTSILPQFYSGHCDVYIHVAIKLLYASSSDVIFCSNSIDEKFDVE